jgi:hypothetical protein
MTEKTKGDCYICGESLGKTAMKNHIAKFHGENAGGQKCALLKIEGAYENNYWLYIDIPLEKSLSDVDKFLRKIWLECCGHLSEFRHTPFQNGIGKNRKLSTFSPGEKFFHIYDFGTTTETVITVSGYTERPPQKSAVRLLARNTPSVFKCVDCGKEAQYMCEDFDDEAYDYPFYCTDCAEKHEDDNHILYPVTNSPRMGQCDYTGEFDCFEFKPGETGKDGVKK